MANWRTPRQVELEEGIDLFKEVETLQAQGLGTTEIAAMFRIKLQSLTAFMNQRRLQREINESRHSLGIEGKGWTVHQVAKKVYGKNLLILLLEWMKDPSVTASDVAIRLGADPSNTRKILKKYGLSLSRTEARNRAIQTGKVNYSDIIPKSRRSQSKRSLLGSTLSQKVTWLLKEELTSSPISGWDLIVGFSEWTIIHPKEVDIPVVALAPGVFFSDRRAVAFAIELDMKHSHGNRRHQDYTKDLLLSERGWLPLRISVPDNPSSSDLEETARALASDIRARLVEL